MKLFSKTLWSVLTVVMSTFLVISISLYTIAYSYEPLLNATFDLEKYRQVNDESGTVSNEYFTAKYATTEAIHANSDEVSEKVEAEGLVLLKNDGALPLDTSRDLKVSLFGTGSVKINCSVQGMRGGSGIGVNDGGSSLPTLKGVLEERNDANGKIEVNPTLWDFYVNGGGKGYGGTNKIEETTNIQTYYINEVPWSKYDATITGTFAQYSDAAIVVFTRDATEGSDVNVFGSDGENGNYLALSPEEKDLLKELTRLKVNGTFDSIIVLLNEASTLQLDFLQDENIAVDACMWIGNTGMSGIRAVAKALTGEVVPSGRLSDTFVYDNLSSPAMASWSLNSYQRTYRGEQIDIKGTFSSFYNDSRLDNTQRYYGVYVEGIYVGYRYYETRYSDVVEGKGNAGAYKYTDTVAYPFGYGQSYTSFDYSNYAVTENADGKTYDVAVKVTNTGATYSGKEVVQIYLQKPYTNYAVRAKMEVPAVELIGFSKTGVLAPGASQTLHITVEKENFTSYDAYGEETYILDAGTYYLAAGKNSHDALNNILAKKGYTTVDGMDYNGNASLVWSTTVNAMDSTTYAVSGETGEAVTNRMAFADVNVNLNAGNNRVTYVSRSDWEGTWPTTPVTLELTESFVEDLQSDKEPESVGELPKFGESNGLSLIMLRGKDYDDEDWDKLLNQLTFDDYNLLLSTAYCITAALPDIAKPQTKEMDGPTYCKEGKTDSRFPCEGIWSSTYNVELLYAVGEALANDCLFVGYNGMWIPGINMHRTPYGGRVHEYFSEDPYLTGIAVQEEIKGIQDYGVIAYPKHFAFNDQEANRNGISIWLNEQEAREIILRPWKYACSPNRGNAHGVMSSFNRVGNIWTSASDGLVNGILRDEFGFNGIIITDMADANGTIYMSCVDGIMAGTDIWLSSGRDHSFTAYKNNASVVNAMRESVKRVLYNVVNYSAAMNGYDSNTKLIRQYGWWEITVISVLSAFSVLTAGSLVMLCLSYKKEK